MHSLTHLRNCRVEFKIADVFIPDPETRLVDLDSADILQGKVIDLTVNEREGQLLAIVDVEGLKEQFFVPVDRILSVHEWNSH